MAFPWATVAAVLYYILLPIILILRFIWAILVIISLPFTHALYFLPHLLALPFGFLARFEVRVVPCHHKVALADI